MKETTHQVATAIEQIAKSIQEHGASKDDATLQAAVGDLNTMAAKLRTAAGEKDVKPVESTTTSTKTTAEPKQSATPPMGKAPVDTSTSGESKATSGGKPVDKTAKAKENA